MVVIIHPLLYQSQDIAVADWFTLFTLCLAPLIAHVLIGAPSPTYLSLSRPAWHDRICHYNPTSILWRYALVADRRIRARNWDKFDFAATNALFWTDHGWDGTEDIIKYSRPRCVQLPDSNMVTLLSRDTIKTLIITIQGLQAIILLLGSQIDPAAPRFTIFMAVDIIFFPMALFGLLRLCSSLWLTDEFAFASIEDIPAGTPLAMGCSTTSFELLAGNPSIPEPQRFRHPKAWASTAFRLAYVLVLLALLCLALSFIVPQSSAYVIVYTMTTFVVVLFFITILGFSVIIFIWFMGFKRNTSTVIPCISSIWYKLYTIALTCFGIAVIVIACIETRKTPCGKFTSGSVISGDVLACMSTGFDKTETRQTVDGPYNGTTLYRFSHVNNASFVVARYEDDQQNTFNVTRMCFSNIWGI
ncbi:hypothetical protein BKA59DRAFT_500083 [Fusarium tricinctum]|uniref:Uncharacterized protein n=1 Tax=Fusarium tricinctum TaxID=61284 RepID=A0A8K0S074_9HYPO|nr:hypothetical protein BKA59DRAFT_500083 [Fusarium tricinctum]